MKNEFENEIKKAVCSLGLYWVGKLLFGLSDKLSSLVFGSRGSDGNGKEKKG